MHEAPFAFIELPASRLRTKPRRSGLTMMADFGLTLEQTESLLQMAGNYMDFAKVAVGTARLYRRDYLGAKLAAYKRHQVRPFIGGQFAEFVLATQGREALPRFFEEAAGLGFETIEISDNCVPLSDAERTWLIRQAIAAGLSVLGEVGSKDSQSDPAALVAQARLCFEAGSELVLVEAAEFVAGGRLNTELLEAIQASLEMAKVMIELPGPWISGVTLSQVEDMKKLLVKALGPEVNIANVKPDDVIGTEALRVGLWTVGPEGFRADNAT